MLFFSVNSFAVELPTDLNEAERQEMVRILGISTHTKLLTNPFAMGGYSGFEFGLSYDIINTKDLNNLKPNPAVDDYQNQILIPQISIGKGLYHNFDLHFHFTPFLQESGITQYGGLMKWSFYQATFIPLSMSFVGHMSQININGSYSNVTTGLDLLVGLNVENVAVYFGGGQLQAESRFQSGTGVQAIVDPTDSEVNNENLVYETTRETYTFAGMTINIGEAFLALQLSKHKDPSYAAKLGMRF